VYALQLSESLHVNGLATGVVCRPSPFKVDTREVRQTNVCSESLGKASKNGLWHCCGNPKTRVESQAEFERTEHRSIGFELP
jgi:hypothetical protein